MCMDLLGTLAEAKLPYTIADKALVDRLRVLDAVGCVKAFIPAVHVDCDNCARQDPAIVLEVTARGRKILSRHAKAGRTGFDPAQRPAWLSPLRSTPLHDLFESSMKHLTETDRNALADRLQIMKRRTLDEIRGAAADGATDSPPQDHEVRSHADEAEAERLGDVRVAEFEIDRARLRSIEQAQQRMACGRYGICVDCGNAIPRERLLAQPIAIRCAACQAAAESRARR